MIVTSYYVCVKLTGGEKYWGAIPRTDTLKQAESEYKKALKKYKYVELHQVICDNTIIKQNYSDSE